MYNWYVHDDIVQAHFLVGWVVVFAPSLLHIIDLQMCFMHEAEGKEGQQ